MSKYKTVDLCAGIGGIRKGFELAGGFENIASAEIDEIACKTYQHLYGENPHNDITSDSFKIELQKKQFDVLLAGFPCQAFSSVGLRQGFEDKTKGTVFFDIAKIIQMTQPKVVFLENVQNLLSHDKKNTFRTIVDILEKQLNYHIVGINHDKEDLSYTQSDFLRNSKDFGVPQNRPRVYIVAFNRLYFGDHLNLIPKGTPKKREKFDDCRIPFYPENPNGYCVPEGLSSFVYYDKSEQCLKLNTGLNRKTVSELKERDLLDEDKYGIFPAMYKLCDQLKGGFVRIPHSITVDIDFSSGDYVDNNKDLDGTKLKLTALKRQANSDLFSVNPICRSGIC